MYSITNFNSIVTSSSNQISLRLACFIYNISDNMMYIFLWYPQPKIVFGFQSKIVFIDICVFAQSFNLQQILTKAESSSPEMQICYLCIFWSQDRKESSLHQLKVLFSVHHIPFGNFFSFDSDNWGRTVLFHVFFYFGFIFQFICNLNNIML